MLSRGQSVAAPVEDRAAVPILLQPGEFSLHDTLAAACLGAQPLRPRTGSASGSATSRRG